MCNYFLKVVLPLVFKYRQDIIEGIICTLLKQNKLTYTGLYDHVTKILGSALSYRDFERHINIMLQENRLHKDDSGRKGAKVFFSLTESGIKGYQLEVLGVNEKTTKQRILYQLIFLREIYGLDYSIYEQDLDFFLSNIPASRKDLVIDSEVKLEGISTNTFYKPIKGVSIWRVSLKENKYNKAETYYNIKLPGVSIRDLINPNSKRIISFPLPFDHIRFTEEEVRDGIYKLQNAKLIRPVIYINDEERYGLVNNEFRELLDRLYIIHREKLGLMQHKWMYERCAIEEYKQMEFIYGKKKAHEIMNYSYQIRQGIRKEIKENKRLVQQVQRWQSDYNLRMAKVSEEIRKIKGKYYNTLSRYGFNQDFVENLLFEKIMQS
jgi:hypothetical protein